MRSTFPIVLALMAAVLLVVSGGAAQTAPAPGAPMPAPPAEAGQEGFGAAASILFVVVGLIVIVGVAVKLYDLRRKREAEAVQLQAQVSDALLRDQTLFGLAVTPTVHVPTWRGSPAVIEVAGQVPSAEVKEAALRIIRDEASRVRSDFEIQDRLAVVPILERRVA